MTSNIDKGSSTTIIKNNSNTRHLITNPKITPYREYSIYQKSGENID